MKILCKKCKASFEYKGDNSAQIEYIKCQNVFKITYQAKIICPKCMAVLSPQAQGRDLVGIPVEEIIMKKRSSDGTKVTEETQNTLTRKSFLAKAFDEVKKNLRKEGNEEETIRLKPIVDREESTIKTLPYEKRHLFTRKEAPNKESFIKKTAISIIKGLKNIKERRGWHIKVSKKQAKLLKNFGLSMLLIAFLSSVGQLIPELFESRSTYAVSIQNEAPPAMIIDSEKDARTIVDSNVDVINLEDLRRIFEERMNEKRNEERSRMERLQKSDDTDKRYGEMIASLNLSSRFGYRKDPFSHEKAFHSGIDIPRPYRAPIRAVMDGKVEYAGYKGGYGNLVILRHSNGVRTYYGHNARNAVFRGSRIKKGQVIGYVGMTGRTTGPHLHFETRKNSLPTNPIDFLKKIIKESGKVTI